MPGVLPARVHTVCGEQLHYARTVPRLVRTVALFVCGCACIARVVGVPIEILARCHRGRRRRLTDGMEIDSAATALYVYMAVNSRRRLTAVGCAVPVALQPPPSNRTRL